MLPRAVNSPELLDEPLHDEAVLRQSLGHVAGVNRWLGGRRALLAHVLPLLRIDRTTRILDVGTASGDLPRSIADAARRRAQPVEIVACDVHPQMLSIAAAQCTGYPEISIRPADALALPFANSGFDVTMMSMTLHHFDGHQQVRIMREMARVTSGTIIVNDLLRSRLNYAGARLMAATAWRFNPLTRHDGPLSVLRAFTPADLMELCATAGLRGRVYRHFFQRVVLVAHVTRELK